MIKKLLIAIPLLFLQTSCGKSPVEARKELAQLDIPFDEETCYYRAVEEDSIATDLFLATNIDPGCLIGGAAEAGNIDLVKKALKKEISPDNEYALSALDDAVNSQQNEIAKLLIDKDIKSSEALASAAKLGEIDIVKRLSNKGIKPNYGLIEASRNGHTEVAKLLLDKGADPNLGIEEAARNGQIEIVKLLLDKGAKPNYNSSDKSNKNSSSLCYAAELGNKEIAKLLLDKGANPNSANYYGSCLRFALANDNFEIAEMLEKAGATSPSLTGQWTINYDAYSNIDSSGDIKEIDRNYTRYVNLAQNKSIITGELTSADQGLCTSATINGELQGNNINWTLHHAGSCCPNAKSSYKGRIDYGLSTIDIIGQMEPAATPPQECHLWYANFTATKVDEKTGRALY